MLLVVGKGSARERRPSETWWDKQDEPPEALVHALARAGRLLRRVVPSGEAADSARARTISAVVVVAVFLVLLWLVVAAVLEQA